MSDAPASRDPVFANMQIGSYAKAEAYTKRVLPNGVRVLAQHVPATYSVVLGVFALVGSRDEERRLAGISHFVEHMVFKGTKRRSAFDLALALERVGGSLEAHTTKEHTCFYTRVLREHFDLALDVISDLVLNPTHPVDQIGLEQGVVLEEINNVFDNPEDWIFELLSEKAYDGHPMAWPILGTPESVKGITQTDLQEFMRKAYVGGNVVISVAGAIDVEATIDKIEKMFPVPPGTLEHTKVPVTDTRESTFFQTDANLKQQYLALAKTTFSYDEDDRFPLLLTSTLLGGGMSSRLFQRVREEAGLCYSVYTFSEFTRDVGLAGTFVAVSGENAAPAIDLVWKEYDLLRRDGITEQELDDTRDQLKGGMLLGMENVAGRMSRLAKNEICYGRQIPVQEIIQRLDAVTRDDIVRMAENYFRKDSTLIVGLGPLSKL